MQFHFGHHRLDLERRELWRGQALVPLEPQVFDVLVHLLQHREQVVSKDELIASVWNGRIVSESTLSSRINAARNAIGDSGGEQRQIKTLPRKGFRFVGAVEVSDAKEDSTAEPVPDSFARDREHRSGPHLASLVVLPFINLSGEPEQQYFAAGVVEELVTSLSRIRWLRVLTDPAQGAMDRDAAQAGRTMGAGYVLEGSVRKYRAQVRISAQLVDAESGGRLWADRFEGRIEDAFELQDNVAMSVVGVIEPTLEAAEIQRSGRSRAASASTNDLYLRALADHLSFQRERVFRAIALLDEAIAREPQFGAALAVAAWCHVQIDTYGWAANNEENRREGLALAQRALQVADDDPAVIGRVAFVVGRFGQDIDGALALIDRSLALNPGFAAGWHISGWLRLFAGQPDVAIEHFSKSMTLTPRGQRMEMLTGIGAAHMLGRRFNEAASILSVSLEHFPHFAQTYRYLAVAYAHLGRLNEAREIIERLKTYSSVVIPAHLPFRHPDHQQICVSGLRLAIGDANNAPKTGV